MVLIVGLNLVSIVVDLAVGLLASPLLDASSAHTGKDDLSTEIDSVPCCLHDAANATIQCEYIHSIEFQPEKILVAYENVAASLFSQGVDISETNSSSRHPTVLVRYWIDAYSEKEVSTTLDLV